MITVLGGGVAGVSLVRALALRGRRDVVLYDPTSPGSGSTGGAMGGFRTQHGSELNIRLALSARPYFEARAGRIRFLENGYLYLADAEPMVEELERRAEFQRSMGLTIQHPDPKQLVPFMATDGYLGTNYCALDALYMPRLVLDCLLEEARSAGADIRYGARASEADLDAEMVAVCAGCWSREVGAQLGVELAVDALERVVWQLPPPPGLDERTPLTIEAGSGYHFRERDGQLLVMGPGDQHDFSHYGAWLRRRVPALAGAAPLGHWTCSYEMSFDQHGLAGETARPGVWADCGFSGHGVMQAPVIGDCVAAMMLGETPPLDISALSPMRTEPLYDRTQV